jgi:hypothetical protein
MDGVEPEWDNTNHLFKQNREEQEAAAEASALDFESTDEEPF